MLCSSFNTRLLTSAVSLFIISAYTCAAPATENPRTFEVTSVIPPPPMDYSLCAPDAIDGTCQATSFNVFNCSKHGGCANTDLVRGVSIGRVSDNTLSSNLREYHAVKPPSYNGDYECQNKWLWNRTCTDDMEFMAKQGKVLCNQPEDVNLWVPYKGQNLSTLPHALIPVADRESYNLPICGYHYQGNIMAGVAWRFEDQTSYSCSAMVTRSDTSEYSLEVFTDNSGEEQLNKAKGPLEYILVKAPANNPPINPVCATELNWLDPVKALPVIESGDIAQAVTTYPPESSINYCQVFGFNNGAYTRELGLELPQVNYHTTDVGTQITRNKTLPGGCLIAYNEQIQTIPFVKRTEGMNSASAPHVQYRRLNVPVDYGWVDASAGTKGSPAGCSSAGTETDTAYLCRFIDTLSDTQYYVYGISNGKDCKAVNLSGNGEVELVYSEISKVDGYQVYQPPADLVTPLAEVYQQPADLVTPLTAALLKTSGTTGMSLSVFSLLFGISFSQLR